VTLEPLDDLIARLERERLAADRIYNDALTALDRAISPPSVLPPAPSGADRSRLATINERSQILPTGSPSIDRSLKGRLTGFVWRLIGPPLQRQTEFNSAVGDHLNRTVEAHDKWVDAAVRLREAVQADLQAIGRFHSLLVQYLQTVTAYVDTKDRSLGGPEIRDRLARAEQRLQAIKRELERPVATGTGTEAAASVAFARPVDSATYVGFEDRFRGSSADITRRIEEYLPLLESATEVVDIGCGRGELLAALRTRGVRARGVDANAAMVELCRSQQLDVEQGDALSFLERQPDASLGAVAAIQVVEHFDPAYLVRFLDAAFHKMKPGAPLVLETINAACWMAFFETYIRDLTHQRPLHPDTLRYLVEASGFSSVDVRFRQPVSAGDRLDLVQAGSLAGSDPAVGAVASAVNDHAEKLNARLFSSMDYAVIARR
jgi:2-polyprenyl-3-methyl-5-hydroxy-6-metoxy-1,4-benzoquinol methylase